MMDTVFRNLLEVSLFSLAVIVPLGLCSNLLGRRYGVKWRYLLWVVVAVRLVLPIQLSLPEPMEGMRVNLPAPVISAELPETPGKPETIPTESAGELHLLESQWVGGAKDMLLPFPEEEPEVGFQDFAAERLWLFWIVGALAFAGWQGWKYAAFRRMLKRNSRKVRDTALLDDYYSLCHDMGLEKCPVLYFCGALHSPLCMGLFRQGIYINSEDREPGDMRLILKHELTHCKRRDLWFKALLLLARTMHFFNPFVHWMARLAERDMEYSCDVSVMQDCSLEERQAYSMAILRTVREGQQNGAVLTTAFSGGKKELKTRFENIFDMSVKKRGTALFTAAALAVCCGTAFVGCQAERSDIVYGDYTEEIVTAMYQAKPVSLDDKSSIVELMERMPVPDGVSYHLNEYLLHVYEKPYIGFIVDWEETSETVYAFENENYTDDRWCQIHAMMIFALSDEIETIRYEFRVQEKGYSYSREREFEREDMKRYFGETDLRQFAADEETFRAFVQAVNKYFYQGRDSTREIHELVELDDAAAQKRMTYFLNEAGAGIVYGSYTEAKVRELLNAKLDYVGNASGVGKIFGLFPLPYGVTRSEEGMELFTESLPYGTRWYLDWTVTPETAYKNEAGEIVIDDRWCMIHAMIFFALVDNADYFDYSFMNSEIGETEKVIRAYTRNELAERYFGDIDLRYFASNADTFQRFVLALNRYFYDGIDTPEQLAALLGLDEAAARERMDYMLYDRTMEKRPTDQIERVERLLSAITEENTEAMLSSNPLDYTDCLEYKELVWMGEPALKYCLSAFAAGEDLGTLKGHIMKFACQDILGQERDTEQTPGEWYFLYSAVDSTLCAPFVYDASVYTDELAQYTFDNHTYEPPANEKWSILGAGEDERVRAVYDAVSERYNGNTGGAGHSTVIFAPTIFKMKEEGNRLTVYTRLDLDKYVLIRTDKSGYEFRLWDGRIDFIRLDFEKRNGKWTLEEWAQAETGPGVEERLTKLCAEDPEVGTQMLEGSEDGKLNLQNVVYYMKAHYGEMNIPVVPTDGRFETDVVAEALEQNLKVVPFPLM
ncbi:MAG: DUF4825 domain-containing protein [Anaerotignum sp.]|nr:DUF4825 domain-containing protein [Anaerotignum sp.]